MVLQFGPLQLPSFFELWALCPDTLSQLCFHLLYALQAKGENNGNIKQKIKFLTLLFDCLFLENVLSNKLVQNNKGNVWCFFYPTISAVYYQVLARYRFLSKSVGSISFSGLSACAGWL